MTQTVQCDYMGHVKVNIFYKLKFYFGGDNKNSYFYGQRGQFKRYLKGSTLPLKTLYYKLPDSFYIMTYGNDLMLLNVENGVFAGIVAIDKLNKLDRPVYDTWGNLTVAETANDVNVIKIEHERLEADEISSDEFMSLWIKKQTYPEDVMVFGRYLEIFRELYILQDDDYNKFKVIFKSFLEKQDVVSLKKKYTEWLENEDLIPFHDIDIIVHKVFS